MLICSWIFSVKWITLKTQPLSANQLSAGIHTSIELNLGKYVDPWSFMCCLTWQELTSSGGFGQHHLRDVLFDSLVYETILLDIGDMHLDVGKITRNKKYMFQI